MADPRITPAELCSVKVVPGGQVKLKIDAPEVVAVSFEEEQARCGDKVLVHALLNTWGYGGTVRFEFKTEGGVVVGESVVSTGGEGDVVAEWVSIKTSDQWGADTVDARVTATLLNRKGEEVSTAAAPRALTITRPRNDKAVGCLKNVERRGPIMVRYGNGVWEEVSPRREWAMRSNFDVSFADGVVTITGKIKLVGGARLRRTSKPDAGPIDAPVESDEWEPYGETIEITDAIKAQWKSEIETTWNDWYRAHRLQCGRGTTCTCTKKCCQFDVKIVCEFVEVGEYLMVTVHPGECNLPFGDHGHWSLSHWWQEEGVYGQARAHEFGHAVGLYDEYKGGLLPPGTDPNNYTEPFGSIMCYGGDEALPHHFSEWFDALDDLNDDFYTTIPASKAQAKMRARARLHHVPEPATAAEPPKPKPRRRKPRPPKPAPSPDGAPPTDPPGPRYPIPTIDTDNPYE